MSTSDKIAVKLDPWPAPIRPIVQSQRNVPLALIGIGFSGYSILKTMLERARASHFDLAANDIALIHVELGRRHENRRNRYVQASTNGSLISCYIEGSEPGYSDIRQDARFGKEDWNWLFQFGFHRLVGQQHRHTGRTMLHDHFEFEQERSPLYAKLKTTLNKNTEIVLISSALELYGANLVPDLAVIAKHLSPDGTVTALTLMDALQDRHFTILAGDSRLHQAACYLELAYYNAEHVTAPVLPLADVRYEGSGRLLDAVYFSSSEKGKSVQEAVALLWALCLSGNLSNRLQSLSLPNIMDHNTPKEEMMFNRVFSHEIRAPFEARRELMREMLKKRVIDAGRARGHTDYDRGSRWGLQDDLLNALLRDRHYDLLTPVRLMVNSMRPASTRMKDLEKWLASESQTIQRKINDARDNYKRSITYPFDRLWKDVDPELPNRLLSMGWEWDKAGEFLMRFGLDGPKSFVDNAPFNNYAAQIDEFSDRMSMSMIADDLIALKELLISNEQLRREWSDRFSHWINIMSLELVPGTRLQRETLIFGLRSWDSQISTLEGDDPVGAVQIMLSGRLPLSSTVLLKDVETVLLHEKIIQQPLGRTLRIFHPILTSATERADFLSLPPVFFSFINDEAMFRAFFWSWYNGRLSVLFQTPDLLQSRQKMRPYANLSWLQRVNLFRNGWYSGDNIRRRLEEASLMPLDDDYSPDTADMEYTVLDEHLMWLFEELMQVVNVNSAIDDPELKRLLQTRRGVFEFFLCWVSGAFEGHHQLRLKGNTWVERIDYFVQKILPSDTARVVKAQRYNPAAYPQALTGDGAVQELNRIFAVWQQKADESPHLPILWRWN